MTNKQTIKIFAISLYNACQGKSPKQIDLILENLEHLLTEQHSRKFLPDIIREIKNLEQARKNIVSVQVTSAHVLDELEQKNLADLVTRLTGKQVKLQTNIKADLLGGAVLKYGDKILDLSIYNKLSKLAEHLVS